MAEAKAANGKVALISGANKGLGLETARQLGELGFIVLMGARDLSKGEAAAVELRGDGVDARAVQLDVDSQADIDALAKRVDAEFGGRLDVLVNNAGRSTASAWGPYAASQTDVAELREVFETNFFAVVALTKALMPALRKAPAARIVNLSSILGSVSLAATPGSPTYEMKAFEYNASKAALNMFTIHLAYELRDTKIKVNSAHPGWVKTDMGGEGAMLELAEGAKTGVQLATLGEDGPTGGFFFQGKVVPW